MSIEILWLTVLGYLMVGYLVLDGYDYGIGMLLPVLGRDDRRRRLMLNATGPFLLGNEVWLIAVAGTMVSAFPVLESALFGAYYPLLIALLAGLMLRGVGVQLRRFGTGPGWRAAMDACTVTGSVLPALALGLLTGGVLRGAPLTGPDAAMRLSADLLHPFALLTGLSSVLLLAAHGAVFLALRLTGDARAAAEAAAVRLAPVVLVLLAGAVAAGALSADVRAVAANTVPAAVAAAVLLGAVAAMWALVRRGRTAAAFAASSVAVVAPLLLVLAGAFPRLLVSRGDPAASVTIADGLADPATLTLLAWMLVPFIPVVLAAQAWNWWTFRHRLGEDARLYY